MLQQTQVTTVIPYWNRWMNEFPNIQALAEAPIDRVLKLWEGLGYYSRARNLHRAAILIRNDFKGVFPRDGDSILNLPGIGRYTAGAILSLAFNEPAAILDGNIVRVLSRLMALRMNPKERAAQEQLWKHSELLVLLASKSRSLHSPHLSGNCSAFNQSLMELGATVCKPKAPLCGECPLKGVCCAFRNGSAELYPRLPKARKATPVLLQAFILERDGRIWIGKRKETLVNGGLWEFPNIAIHCSAERPVAKNGKESDGFHPFPQVALTTVRHSITRYRIEVNFSYSRLDDVPEAEVSRWMKRMRDSHPLSQTWSKSCWATSDQVARLPFPSAHSKALGFWLRMRQQPAGEEGFHTEFTEVTE
jgi:A/G-specific adenine glycosylase